jgi:hypothetical protein
MLGRRTGPWPRLGTDASLAILMVEIEQIPGQFVHLLHEVRDFRLACVGFMKDCT